VTLAPNPAADLAALLERSPDVLTRYAPDGTVLYMSASVERATGRPASDFVGRRMDELGFPPDLLAHWRAGLERAIAEGEQHEAEFDFEGPGGPRAYHTVLIPESGPDGAVVSVLTVTRDVTALKRAEAGAREAAHTMRGLVDQSLTGVYVIQDGRFRYVNPRFAEIFGGSVDRILALPSVGALVHPDDRAQVTGLIGRRLDGELGAAHYTFRGMRLDGTEVHVEVHGTAAEYHGHPAVVGVLLDVSERRLHEEALRRSEARFRGLVEHSSDLIAVVDAAGAPLYRSPSFETVLGLAPGQIRETWGQLHPEDLETARRAFAAAMQRGTAATDRPVRIRTTAGTWRAIAVRLTDLRHEPAIGGIVVNARDVTEQLELEAQLRQAQKMEALGQLAGGVAHDFNNILAAITGYAQLLREEIPEGDPRRDDAEEIVAAATRASGITRQLLAFSRHQALETAVVDLADVARRTCAMLRPLLPAAIDLRGPEADAPPAHVRGDEAQFEQVLMNLALNARDAMPRGGVLSVGVTAVRPRGERPSAVLRVEDTGEGMPPEVQARIFEPFFTTKERGKGTGLGLAMVYGIVRQFGGEVRADSVVGEGSTFVVTLPLVDAPRAADAPAPEAGSAPGRRRTLLVVEDDRAVRESARRLLERAGYEVLAAEHGGEGLRILAERGGAVDAVLTDAEMPELSGREFATQAAGRYPGLPLILMSGYAEPGETGEAPWPGVVAFVQKPFLMGQLLATVRSTLAAPRPERPPHEA
jgi:PAS domain S-box-containing protein